MALKRLDRPQGLIVVHGMRGAGKSVLLRRLQETAPHHRGALLVSGRNRAETLRQLAAFSTSDTSSRGLLLDDVDLLLRDPSSGEIDQAVVERLWALKEASFAQNWLFCMTISEPPGTYLEYDSKVSDLLNSGPRAITLKPWETNTRAILAGAMEDRFRNELLQGLTLRFSGHVFRFSSNLITAWRDAVQGLTGGHPTLVGPAMDLFVALLSNPLPSDEVDQRLNPAEPDPELLIPGIRAELARTGMMYVRRRIHALSTCARRREQAAYAVLLDMARGQTPTAATLLNRIGMVLEREGLAYLDQPTGVYRFVGSMVEGALKARLDNEQLTPRASKILLDPGPDPARGGVAYTVSPGGRREVELTGSLWAVLRVLDARRSTFVSLSTLMETTQLKEAAARSALHRLSLRLREGLGTGIENAYAQGYRLS
jgi:energy-coupling factor transporter ATP-binding protein EcfA2